jgi:hypothetical protein
MPSLREEGLKNILFQQDGAERLFICTLQWGTADRKFHRNEPAETALSWPPCFSDLAQLYFF